MTKRKTGSGNTNLTSINGPAWPHTDLFARLHPEYQRYRDRLLAACHASRGVIISDISTADIAAGCLQDVRRWRAIGDMLVKEAAEGNPPDINAMAKASARAEAAARANRTAVQSLGLMGREIGGRRARAVIAHESIAGPDDDWDHLLGHGTPEEPAT